MYELREYKFNKLINAATDWSEAILFNWEKINQAFLGYKFQVNYFKLNMFRSSKKPEQVSEDNEKFENLWYWLIPMIDIISPPEVGITLSLLNLSFVKACQICQVLVHILSMPEIVDFILIPESPFWIS